MSYFFACNGVPQAFIRSSSEQDEDRQEVLLGRSKRQSQFKQGAPYYKKEVAWTLRHAEHQMCGVPACCKQGSARKGQQYLRRVSLVQRLKARAAQMLRPVGLDPQTVGMSPPLSQKTQLGADVFWASLCNTANKDS